MELYYESIKSWIEIGLLQFSTIKSNYQNQKIGLVQFVPITL